MTFWIILVLFPILLGALRADARLERLSENIEIPSRGHITVLKRHKRDEQRRH